MASEISEIYNYTTYQEAARETCSYEAIDGSFLTYPVLGTAGECGEVIEKIKKVYRDNGGVIDPSACYALMTEIGDVLWFISALCDELDLRLADISMDESADKSKWAKSSLADLGIEIAYLSGSIASASTLGRLNKSVMVHSVKQLLIFIQVLADRIGVPMTTIMLKNIEKLRYRVKTGKISGSGDHR